MKKLLMAFIALTMLLTSSMAFAGQNDDINIVTDILFFRPIGLASMAFGGGLFVVSWPLAKITDSDDKTLRVLVKEPFEYTIKRPVGKIESALK